MGDFLKSLPEATSSFLGLLFFLMLLALMCSLITEYVSHARRLRAKTLEKGIKNLLGEELTIRFYSHPYIKGFALAEPRALDKPAYIPSRIFAWVLLDIICTGKTSSQRFNDLCEAISKLAEGDLKRLFSVFIQESDGDIKKLHSNIQFWFENAMGRVSAWYRLKVQKILFVIGLAVSLMLNADAVMVVKILSRAPMIRSSIAKIAEKNIESIALRKAVEKPDQAARKGDVISEAMERLPPDITGRPLTSYAQALTELVEYYSRELDLLGWSRSRWEGMHSIGQFISKLVGLLITAFSVAAIAPLLFDIVNRLVNIRGSERRPSEVSGS